MNSAGTRCDESRASLWCQRAEAANEAAERPSETTPESATVDWSGRQDLNLRPPGPEGAQEQSHGVSGAGFGSQVAETTGEQQAPILDPVAENGSVETPFGAPVVRELPPDPGPHERLTTVRSVAARLGLSSASIYKLCQRGELRGMRIGGALRFSPQVIDDYVTRCAARRRSSRRSP